MTGTTAPVPAGSGRCPFHEVEPPAFPCPRANPLNPPPYYGELRDSGQLQKLRLWDGSLAWIITRYDDFRAVVSDPRFSADITREGYPTVNAGMKVARGKYPSLITMDAPRHTRHRRMLTGEFAVKRMEAYRPKIQRIVTELIDAMVEHGGPLDLVEHLALPIPSLAICELLGVPYEDHDFFQAKAKVLASHKTSREEALAAGHELCEVYLRGLIRKKDAHPEDDILSRLVVKQLRTGELSEDELISMSRLLLIAGHETTANMTAMGTLLLLQHREQWEALRADPALVPQAVEEMLRFLDPTHSGRRRVALEDVELRGTTIRAGEGVIALGLSANRDGNAFPEPDRFDIRREARHHVAFGYGNHQCLGQPLARIELQTVFTELIRRLPGLKLAVPGDSLHFKDEMFVYGVKELPVQW
ncbi:MAG: putative cytochrome hydroxylase [Paucimonas sp.]|nr:putative cytochrome hydroxylase [Paucimonas sp.]